MRIALIFTLLLLIACAAPQETQQPVASAEAPVSEHVNPTVNEPVKPAEPVTPQKAAVPEAPSATGKTMDVSIENFKFSEVRVKLGDTVRWTNKDAAPHTATGSEWDTGTLNKGQSNTWKPTSKGTFDYVCKFHPSMKGKVIVE